MGSLKQPEVTRSQEASRSSSLPDPIPSTRGHYALGHGERRQRHTAEGKRGGAERRQVGRAAVYEHTSQSGPAHHALGYDLLVALERGPHTGYGMFSYKSWGLPAAVFAQYLRKSEALCGGTGLLFVTRPYRLDLRTTVYVDGSRSVSQRRISRVTRTSGKFLDDVITATSRDIPLYVRPSTAMFKFGKSVIIVD